MAKRRLSKQQQRRIASNQKNRINNTFSAKDGEVFDARVISHHGRQLYAERLNAAGDYEKIKCKIRQNLGDIACGDNIVVQKVSNAAGKTEYIVVAIRERDNLLVKTGFNGAIKPIAANIGQLVIVSAAQPKPNAYLIDRYITAAENLPAKSLIVFNKIELADEESRVLIEDLSRLYSGIGYRVISCSVKQDIGIAEIAEALSNTTSILVGLSGVGKSSIVKKILPELEIKIGETSQATGEGRHTTTVSALYHLKDDGIIIDSPGVRDFTPIHHSIEEITHGFVDIRQYSGQCKFSNCRHRNEPGCAIKLAVAEGKINEQRFRNYLRMIEEFEAQ